MDFLKILKSLKKNLVARSQSKNSKVEKLLIFAKDLEGKKVSDVAHPSRFEEFANKKPNQLKSFVADVVEEDYFGIKKNNLNKPDFEELEVELKVSPIVVRNDKTIRAKERSVLSMLDYNEIAQNKDWKNCSFAKKLKILYVVYEWKKGEKKHLDYVYQYVFLWEPDITQQQEISRDYKIIRDNVLAGRVLSEKDTNFLGAVSKSAGRFPSHLKGLAEQFSIDDYEKIESVKQIQRIKGKHWKEDLISELMKHKRKMKSSKNSFLADHPVLSRELSERKGWVIKQPAFTKIIMNSLSLTEIREFTLENLNKLK